MYKVPDIELTYIPKIKVSQLPIVTDIHQAYKFFYNKWDKGKLQFIEQFKILLLNHDCRVLGIYEVSTGGLSGTAADPKLIFIAALKACATSIILAHNHPSGNKKPSKTDIRLTRRIKEAGRLLEINVWDHLIITSDGYTSLHKAGYI